MKLFVPKKYWAVFLFAAVIAFSGLVYSVVNAASIERASIAFDGTQGNLPSYNSAVSADGRFVAFTSDSSNLVPDDTNNIYDVFVRDRLLGTTERVSVSTNGTQKDKEPYPWGYLTYPVSISADGRYVAFSSGASTLAPNDGNLANSSESFDIFVRDRQLGTTERVSISSDGTPGNKESEYSAISANGRYIVFTSRSSNLVPGDTGWLTDIFVRDRLLGTTERVSVSSNGTQGNNWSVWLPAISSDGRFVSFTSLASNLVPGDVNNTYDVFVRDRQLGTTERVSVSSDGIGGDKDSQNPSISDDGRYIAFTSWATNLVKNRTNGTSYIRDRQNGTTELISDTANFPGISGDGRFVVASINGVISVYDVVTHVIKPASYAFGGAPFISSGSHYISFLSNSSDLVPNDTNGAVDIFVIKNPFDDNDIPPPTDVCPNIDGVQTTVPENRHLSNGQCVLNDGQITVIKHVINDDGGTKTAVDFTLHANIKQSFFDYTLTLISPNTAFASDGIYAPATFPGDENGTAISYTGTKKFTITEDADSGYTTSYSVGCTGTINPGDMLTCTVTNDDIAPVISFTTVTETEDDGVNDTKGVADKTQFTFSTTVTGEPDSVRLTINGTLYGELTKNGDNWSITKSFPKGEYPWQIEAKKGTEVVKTDEKKITTGYSNVAFLPGIQASRLYRQQTFENQLWEPNGFLDLQKLRLSPTTGNSINDGIYTRDIIDQKNVIPDPSGLLQGDIYLGFEKFMDEEMKGNIIHDWKAIPYDWRLDFDWLLNSGITNGENIYYADSVTDKPYILEEIAKLVNSSDTGKVTIVAHSMGGLVSKALMEKIKDESHPYHYLYNKIDQVILVASPQLGTPATLEALLHANEGTLGLFGLDFIADEEDVRELGENMQSAYNLLPSREYFSRTSTPVLSFDGNRYCGLTAIFTYGLCFPELYDRAGKSITEYEDMKTFLLGDNGKRTEPAPDNEEYPNVLKSRFINKADTLHNQIDIDSWVPEKTEVTQIVGWGEKTIAGMEYLCKKLSCFSADTLDRKLILTKNGDGTVVVPSAAASTTATTYYLNLEKYNNEYKTNLTHAEIFETTSVQKMIKNLVQHKTEFSLPAYSTEDKPAQTDTEFELIVWSPVSINVFDGGGRHTGLIDTPEGSDLRYYETQIPNSYYVESAGHKYVGFGTNDTFDIELKGEKLGLFTLDIKKTFADSVTEEHNFVNIPVTESTKASFPVTDNNVSEMKLDVDGNGIADVTINPNDEHSTASLSVLEQVVKTLNIESGLKNSLVKKVQNAIKSQNNQNASATKGQLSALKNEIEAQKGKKIDITVAEQLINIIDRITIMVI